VLFLVIVIVRTDFTIYLTIDFLQYSKVYYLPL